MQAKSVKNNVKVIAFVEDMAASGNLFYFILLLRPGSFT